MLTIRLTRTGKKNQPFFRLVLVDKRKSSKAGRSLEVLGFVNPLKKQKQLKTERIKHWISKGAQPSPTVHNLLVKEGIVKAKKIPVHKKSKKEAPAAKPAPAPASVPAAQLPTEPVPAAEPAAAPAQPAEPAAAETPTAEQPPTS